MRKQRITYTSPLDALVVVSKRLSLYENQQQMNSEIFIGRYRKGLMPDDTLFVEWSNDYQHYLALHQQLTDIAHNKPELLDVLKEEH